MQLNTRTRKCWSVFAETLAAEAGERRIHHTSFSLPKFIVFLNSGCEQWPANSVLALDDS